MSECAKELESIITLAKTYLNLGKSDLKDSPFTAALKISYKLSETTLVPQMRHLALSHCTCGQCREIYNVYVGTTKKG